MSTRRQILRFAISGVLATATDASVYALGLHLVFDGRHDPAKALSFIAGTTVAFLLARSWTFADAPQRAGQGAAFFALYTTAFAVNVGANHVGLALGLPAAIAFVAATACSMVLNFLGQKFLVFRPG